MNIEQTKVKCNPLVLRWMRTDTEYVCVVKQECIAVEWKYMEYCYTTEFNKTVVWQTKNNFFGKNTIYSST